MGSDSRGNFKSPADPGQQAAAPQPSRPLSPAGRPAAVRQPAGAQAAGARSPDSPAVQIGGQRQQESGHAPVSVYAPTTAPPAAAPEAAAPAQAAGAEDDELTGKVVAGRYRVLKKLGEGGMGAVYLAEHVTIEKKVALKVLLHEYARKADLKERFLQEAKAAARIGHENIVDITDFGDTPDHSVFFAMEFLEGIDLAQLIREQGPIPWTRAKPILLQICRALGAAHSKGIIHRDMKPENIYLIEREGRADFVKVLDFGIAKMSASDRESRLTRTGMIFGTPEYMSPEQAQGNKPDHRVDIYAVGVIMYEMLTGRVPFKADTFMGILTKHIFEQPLPPSQMNPEVVIPVEAERIVLKAMDKEREQRFQSMAEMAAAITSASGRVTRPTGDISTADPRIMQAAPRRAGATGQQVSVSRVASATAEIGELPPRSRLPLVIVLSLGLLLAGGAVTGVVLIKKKGRGPGAVAGIPAPTALRPDAGRKSETEQHELLLRSQPPGASVFQGDRKLGVTPVRLKFARSSRKLLLVLQRDGHRDGTFAFTPSGGTTEGTIRLEPVAAEAPTPSRTRPAHKTLKVRRPEPHKAEPKKAEPKKAEPKKAEPPKKDPPPKKKTEQSGDLMNPFGD